MMRNTRIPSTTPRTGLTSRWPSPSCLAFADMEPLLQQAAGCIGHCAALQSARDPYCRGRAGAPGSGGRGTRPFLDRGSDRQRLPRLAGLDHLEEDVELGALLV